MMFQWKYKLRSGALQFTIFISVVIALVLAGIILLAYTHRFFREQSDAIIENIQLADSGMSALYKEDNVTSDTLLLELPVAGDEQKVQMHLSHWGLFEKAYVKTTHRKKQFIKCSLMGSGIAINRPALYLQETFKPLAVVGTTKISGPALLPEQGIRTGNIAGNSYYGTELVYGKTEKSTTELPPLKYDYKATIDFYLHTYEPKGQDTYIELGSKKIIQNSFKSPVKGFYSKQPITLDNTTIQGNIIIRSDIKITVKKTAFLKDILLAAPIIEIQDGTHGNFQAFASKTINIGKNCLLNYPSALVLQKDEINPIENNPTFNKISIDENSVVKGSICYFGPKEENYKVNIFMAPMSSLKGEIYCQGNLELRGNVAGTVYTKLFVTNEAGTIFVNHLYNAAISTQNFPESFGGLLFKNNAKTVMKWLY